MALDKPYTSELGNTKSPVFLETSTEIENEVLPILQESIDEVVAVKVTRFSNGSIIVDFDIILDAFTEIVVPLTVVKEAITTAIHDGSLDTLNVFRNQPVTVTGCYIQFYYLILDHFRQIYSK